MKINGSIRLNAEAAVVVMALKEYIKVGNWLASIFPECNAIRITATYQGSMLDTAKLQQERSDKVILEANKLVKALNLPALPVIKTHEGWWDYRYNR